MTRTIALDVEDFKFLSWLQLVAFFPDDFKNELIQLGMDEGKAFLLSRSEAVKESDVVKLYRDYFRTHDTELFDRFIQGKLASYNKLKAQVYDEA